MYLPDHFRETDTQRLRALIAAAPLATVITRSARGPEADLIPLQLIPGSPDRLIGHVARGNPLWQQHPEREPVLAIFQGPQAYVSPSAYPGKQQHGKVVPTWNYVCVEVRGTLKTIDDPERLRLVLEELTRQHEANQPIPWQPSDAPADYLAAMLRGIVGIEIEIVELSGKWKVSQNKSAEDRAGIMSAWQRQEQGKDPRDESGRDANPSGNNEKALASLMRDYPYHSAKKAAL